MFSRNIDPTGLKQFPEVSQGDDDIRFRSSLTQTGPDEDHRRVRAISSPDVIDLRLGRGLDRREKWHELRVIVPNRFHHHRARRPDHRAPPTLRPQPLVLVGHQLVADHPPVHNRKTTSVAGIYDLLRLAGVEVDLRLRTQQQHRIPPVRVLERQAQIAECIDRVVRTGRHTGPASDTPVIDDLDCRSVDGNRIDGAHTHARQTGDAPVVIDLENDAGGLLSHSWLYFSSNHAAHRPKSQ